MEAAGIHNTNIQQSADNEEADLFQETNPQPSVSWYGRRVPFSVILALGQ